jgi:hypothetical protein
MFNTFTVKQLKSLISEHKKHHDINKVSKMKKAQLVAALEARFYIQNGILYLKTEEPVRTAAVNNIAPAAVTVAPNGKRRIATTLMTSAPTSINIPQQQTTQRVLSAGEQRFKNTIDSLANRYTDDIDRNPDYAIRTKGRK